MTAERVRFSAEGVNAPQLEGELWRPDRGEAVTGVVVAHPHPLRGGNMDSNVVMALCQGLNEAGIATLRFNFRGVGRSEGKHGEGVDEVFDILGALAYLSSQPGVDPGRIGLAGYSFGARVSLATAPRVPTLRALLCVAPPLREPIPADGWPPCPLLVLAGSQDGVLSVGADTYASYLPSLDQLRVVPVTDHFWRGFEPVLVEAARTFFSPHLSSVAAGATA